MHIPGAVGIPRAQAASRDGTFKAPAALRELYAGKGVTPDQDVTAYCRISERSSHTWFVLRKASGARPRGLLPRHPASCELRAPHRQSALWRA